MDFQHLHRVVYNCLQCNISSRGPGTLFWLLCVPACMLHINSQKHKYMKIRKSFLRTYILCCCGVHGVDCAVLKVRDLPVSATSALGLKACITMPGLKHEFLIICFNFLYVSICLRAYLYTIDIQCHGCQSWHWISWN